jgi:hypothetical protein
MPQWDSFVNSTGKTGPQHASIGNSMGKQWGKIFLLMALIANLAYYKNSRKTSCYAIYIIPDCHRNSNNVNRDLASRKHPIAFAFVKRKLAAHHNATSEEPM